MIRFILLIFYNVKIHQLAVLFVFSLLILNACEPDQDVFNESFYEQNASLENRDLSLVSISYSRSFLKAEWIKFIADPIIIEDLDRNDPKFVTPCFDCTQTIENDNVITSYTPLKTIRGNYFSYYMRIAQHKQTGVIHKTLTKKEDLLNPTCGLDISILSTFTPFNREQIIKRQITTVSTLFCVLDHARFGSSDIEDILEQIEYDGICPKKSTGDPATNLEKDVLCVTLTEFFKECDYDVLYGVLINERNCTYLSTETQLGGCDPTSDPNPTTTWTPLPPNDCQDGPTKPTYGR